MISLRLLLFLSTNLVYLIVITTSQTEVWYQLCVDSNGNYTANSTYQANLHTLLTSIYTNTEIDNGFYNFSYGENSDQVNAIALCRGDITPDACRVCTNYSSQAITSICPTQKEAIIGLEKCMLRYSNRYIFNLMEDAPYFFGYNLNNVSDVSGFNESRTTLLDQLSYQAAAGGSSQKYAYGQLGAPNYEIIYAIAQCTPDITESECRYCLYNATARIPQCCEESQGGRILYPSCNFRFETNRFYDIPIDASPSPPPTNSTGNNTIRTVIIVVSVITTVIIIIGICIFIRLRVRKPYKEVEKLEDIGQVKLLQLDFDTVRVATDDFSDANKLGEGGFGAVYKGKLSNGQEIAVKRLSQKSGQGDLEFKNEVVLVAKLQHRNLVRLLGFCLERTERLLIYEFVPNLSLNIFIFVDNLKRSLLYWEMRYNIIRGIARGLLYLHEDSRFRVIHRDLKAGNILLDAEMNPKISDFGMARLFLMDQTHGDTRRVAGTFGYMAPEYVGRGHFSVKSDVFSFGVLVLEIVTGQKNNNFRNEEIEEHLLTFAWQSWHEGRASRIIDPTLRANPSDEMLRCIHIGLLCVQENADDRPTMAEVVVMLTTPTVPLSVPSQPAFWMKSSANPGITPSDQSNPGSSQLSVDEASITELVPR
ncbi:Stress-antifung domain-containing protein/Pkinase_Tyr domain-containing protein [Cephalotus follicularis]|uniref:Stress-antifung domain-containing protein/Pkinase_Tyr domain-containing protein n=1 Tax=Cephalotus follicularis TaxID=3775 RepID=A0A1Q3CXF6_CEPFO|nr:Stress-antifung domain-containing protein/Pkinase_Tyr domain-containing protein [Cephalotus follicularis]